jgi:hypothetical protein
MKTQHYFFFKILLLLSLSCSAWAQNVPPLPYIDQGACPFECCTYREWTAAAPVTVYQHLDDETQTLFTLNAGEKVVALTGAVITYKPGLVKILKATQLGYLSGGQQRVLSLQEGEMVHMLHYVGEGLDAFWYQGKIYYDALQLMKGESLEILSHPVNAWWVQIKNQKGQIGWTNQSDEFDNQDSCR